MHKHEVSREGCDYALAMFSPSWDSIASVVQTPVVKLIIAALLGLWQTFRDDHVVTLGLLVVLVLIDMGLGVWAAVKTKTFKSGKFRNTALKLFAYVIVVAVLHVLGYAYEDVESLSLDQGALLYFSATEVLSVFENLRIVTGVSLPTVLLGRIGKIVKFLKKEDKGA